MTGQDFQTKENQINHVVITGGAGFIGSLLTGELLRLGIHVTVIDDLLFGGESLLAYLSHPNFHFFKANVLETRVLRSSLWTDWSKPDSIVHLAAIVGFPACQALGRQVAWRYNVEATQRVFDQANTLGVKRLPETVVTYKDMTFGGDMRDITVSYEKISRQLGFQTRFTPEDGIREVLYALRSGLISNPHDQHYLNAQFIVQ